MNRPMEHKALRVIISGGGTGGHIFPAVSIAGKLKVPAAGSKIVGLPITGLQRQLTLKNIINDLSVPFRVVSSISKARRIIKEFKPQVAIGVGGYASAPPLMAATKMGIPSLIQEQNGFAGLTNKKLGGKVQCICVAYEGMERFWSQSLQETHFRGGRKPWKFEIQPEHAEMDLRGMPRIRGSGCALAVRKILQSRHRPVHG